MNREKKRIPKEVRVSKDSDKIESQSNSLINENLRENRESKNQENKNLRENRESKNQENINTAILESTNKTTHLESKKLDSIKETTIHTESSKLKSKRDSKNNNEVRFDSNGDEIVYEVRHKLSLWDYFMFGVMLFLGIIMLYVGIENLLSRDLESQVKGIMVILIFGIPLVLMSCHRLFYTRKNRFYVTDSGIGFERRKWFRMQKRFFRFGEVGFAIKDLSALYFDSSINTFIIYPISITYKLMVFNFLRGKNYKYYTFCKVLSEFYLDDIKAILVFIRQKTKEALESKGIYISDSELKEKIKHLIYKDI